MSFAPDLSLENSADSYLCFQLVFLHSVSYFFFLYWSPSSPLYTIFDAISSNLDEVLSINPSANVFVFGNFNVYHKDWLTYSGGTDRPGDLTQLFNFRTQIPDCDSHSLSLLDLFLSSDASICCTMAFPPLGDSDNVVVSVSNDFLSNSKWDPLFPKLMRILVLIDMVFVIIWEIFRVRICLNSVNSVLLLLLVNFVSGFRLEFMYISLIVYISSNLTHLHSFQLLVVLP